MVAKLYDSRDNMYLYVDKVTSVRHTKDLGLTLDVVHNDGVGFIQRGDDFLNVYDNKGNSIIVHDYLFDIAKVRSLPQPVGVIYLYLEDGSERCYLHDGNRVGYLMNDDGTNIERL